MDVDLLEFFDEVGQVADAASELGRAARKGCAFASAAASSPTVGEAAEGKVAGTDSLLFRSAEAGVPGFANPARAAAERRMLSG